MEDYIFESGLIVGRFQHIHIGHEKLIKIGLKLCNKLLVFIGSATEKPSFENPYSVEERIEIIYDIFKDEIDSGRLILVPLNDLEDKSIISHVWGEYVLENSRKVIGENPRCIIYGKDKNIFKCFTKEVVDNISEVFVDRKELLISATQMRNFLLQDNKEEWKKYSNPKIHYRYDELKRKLENSML